MDPLDEEDIDLAMKLDFEDFDRFNEAHVSQMGITSIGYVYVQHHENGKNQDYHGQDHEHN